MGGVARLGVALTVLACLPAGLPAAAAAAAGASIEGTVSEAEGGKAGIAGICVEVTPVGAGSFASATTTAGGKYKVEELRAGTYHVLFENCPGGTHDVAPRYWDEKSKSAGPDPLTLLEGEEKKGIEASMRLGGEIHGRLLNGQGQPLAGVCVEAFESQVGEEDATAETGADGEYTLLGLPSGSFKVEYAPCSANVVAGYYDQENPPGYITSDFLSASAVAVTAEEATVTPVDLPDVSMEAGAEIEGSIRDAEGALVTAPLCVSAIDATEKASRTLTTTGRYKLTSLPSGSYRLLIEECAGTEGAPVWASQYYDGAGSLNAATPIALTSGIEPPTPAVASFKLVRYSARRPTSEGLPGIAGTAAVGDTLTCLPGTWSATPAPAFSYQWLRDGATPIPGATSSQYTVQTVDQGAAISCAVTATNEAGQTTAASAAVQVPPPASPVPAPKGGAVAVVAGHAVVVDGVATLKLHCTGTIACNGSVALQYTLRRGHGRGTKRVTVTIGRGSFSIAAGGREHMRIALTRKGRHLLAAAGRHGLKVHVGGKDVKPGTLLLLLRRRSKR
jgi:hypothetical protein